MAECIPNIQMTGIIEDMCKISKPFENFYTMEIPKLKGKPICWIVSSGMAGCAVFPTEETQKKYYIKLNLCEFLKLNKNKKYYLIAHEIGHLVQYAKGIPGLRFHPQKQENITNLLNSMIYDFSVNVKLKNYGIEIPFFCHEPPHMKPDFELEYIFWYVYIRRYICLLDARNKKEIQVCLAKYQDNHLVTIGDKILEIINDSTLNDSNKSFRIDEIKYIIEKISVNLKEFFPSPYKCKPIVSQDKYTITIQMG